MASRSTTQPPQSAPKSPFFQQRDALVGEIAIACLPFSHSLSHHERKIHSLTFSTKQSLENVLQNMNKLNRSLEGVIAVGNEFGAVEALWSQFEGVMAQEPEEEGKDGEIEGSEEGEEEAESAGEAEKADEKGRGR